MMITTRISVALVIAAAILGGSAALAIAQDLGLVSPDTARRVMQVAAGLVLACYGNYVPKQGFPSRAACAGSRLRSALRLGGWLMTLAGLSYSALWAFAPLWFADVAGMVVVGTATAATVAYSWWAVLDARAARA